MALRGAGGEALPPEGWLWEGRSRSSPRECYPKSLPRSRGAARSTTRSSPSAAVQVAAMPCTGFFGALSHELLIEHLGAFTFSNQKPELRQTPGAPGAGTQRWLCRCRAAPALSADICPRDGTRVPGTAPGGGAFAVLSEGPSSTGLAIANDICRERKRFARLFRFCTLFCSLASCSRVCDTGISTATSHTQGYDFSRGTCRKR